MFGRHVYCREVLEEYCTSCQIFVSFRHCLIFLFCSCQKIIMFEGASRQLLFRKSEQHLQNKDLEILTPRSITSVSFNSKIEIAGCLCDSQLKSWKRVSDHFNSEYLFRRKIKFYKLRQHYWTRYGVVLINFCERKI